MTKGYKGCYDYRCLKQIYEIGEEYKIDAKPIICSKGFHYCEKARYVLDYYPYRPNFKLLEIEDLSRETVCEFDKSCSNHILIVREITDPAELLSLLTVYYEFDSNGNQTLYKNIDGSWSKSTYNSRGGQLTYKDSEEYSFERTYDEAGRLLTYKTSEGYCKEITYDDDGIILTCKDRFSDGDWRIFDSSDKKFISGDLL
jgi:hypothetical protein